MSLRPHHCLRSRAETNWRPGWLLVLSLSLACAVRGDTPPAQIRFIFKPQSTPAESIFLLPVFVNVIGAAIFVDVFSLMAFLPAARVIHSLQTEAQPPNTVSAGRHIFESTSCINCHTIFGTVAHGRFGPDFTHFMSRETLRAGAATNTHENLRAWIQDSDSIKPGSLLPAMKVTV